ncbi:MAG: nucleoside phosphorylase [Caldilineaceae bacterium]|nr:nucleoside phosphorylase [Caldilineaceae bacterium]
MTGNRPDPDTLPPLLRNKVYDAPSEFAPENLLREARRQKNLPHCAMPEIGILDPDGDIVRYLTATGQADRDPCWACYHTDLYRFEYAGLKFGIVGCAVGASFAVLVAEEMFASGCRLLISVTSSGQITPAGAPPYFVLIERALRDEGASYHYLPPSDYVALNPAWLELLNGAFAGLPVPVHLGATWTTDAPFRETAIAIEAARSEGILAVEMEAAALYAFAQARQKPVICFAHVTNQMGNVEGDFEKGEANGSRDALALIAATAKRWFAR